MDGVTYTTLDDTSVKVTGFSLSLVDVVIPSEVTYQNVTYQVKEIGEKGLFCSSSSTSKMKTLVISEGVEKIGKQGISGNKALQTVELPSTLEEIGSEAFNNLSSLTMVTFPNGSTLKTISDKAFRYCRILEKIDFYPNNMTPSYMVCTFPETLETIGSYAFQGVPAFKSIILSGGIGKIGGNAFYECSNLEYLWVQEGITKINSSSFAKCPELKYVVLPSTLSSVGSGAFFRADSQTSRTFVFLADEPFPDSGPVQTDFYGLYLPANITAVAGDHFYVKESAIQKYRNAWKHIPSDVFDYMIPFNAELTYSTNYREFDMDFHVAATKGNKPFVATSYNNNTVTFTSIDDFLVPAETGIVIRKNSDEDTWFQIAEQQGNTLSMNNYLKGFTYSDVLTPTTEDGYVNYVLYNGVFSQFNNAGKLGDHKAYLQLPTQTAGASLSFSFDNNSDGIIEINHQLNESEKVYNLNGARISNPKKGIYIKNGKKIIIK